MNQYNVKQMKLDPRDFQHPLDKAISDKINKMDAFQKALEFISKKGIEKQTKILYSSSFAQLTPKNAPVIFKMLEEAAELYGVSIIPEVYIEREYPMIVTLEGIETPMITISTTFLENISKEGLWGMLASEMAGIKNGFCKIKLVEKMCKSSYGLLPEVISQPLLLAFRNWHKYAQYSLDRACLIACGDFNTAMRSVLLGETSNDVLDKMLFDDPNCDYMQQCKEFLNNENKLTSSLRNVNSVISEYSYYASRYIELFNFYQTEYYDIVEDYI